jgi:hypothetical protein
LVDFFISGHLELPSVNEAAILAALSQQSTSPPLEYFGGADDGILEAKTFGGSWSPNTSPVQAENTLVLPEKVPVPAVIPTVPSPDWTPGPFASSPTQRPSQIELPGTSEPFFF